ADADDDASGEDREDLAAASTRGGQVHLHRSKEAALIWDRITAHAEHGTGRRDTPGPRRRERAPCGPHGVRPTRGFRTRVRQATAIEATSSGMPGPNGVDTEPFWM